MYDHYVAPQSLFDLPGHARRWAPITDQARHGCSGSGNGDRKSRCQLMPIFRTPLSASPAFHLRFLTSAVKLQWKHRPVVLFSCWRYARRSGYRGLRRVPPGRIETTTVVKKSRFQYIAQPIGDCRSVADIERETVYSPVVVLRSTLLHHAKQSRSRGSSRKAVKSC